ncbi:serine hydroxymethyltransferase [bacterium]|jgi:glycine hydroxymethyltransferase|nr:serine hydroxymethyltransferase [bacterium]MBT3903673.1 serine hydroxymethyltransferase [bacterium]MBT4578085.1 serine hydroxymethyltransferase [bacterium]MBT5346176.1 serine hydroxymethyltransferase [bacterium]MBT6130972.1 serine hydroxymethyltransferase [bacterium]
MSDTLQSFDPTLYEIIEGERSRQLSTINLIASENYVSPVVREAMSSVLTHKYAEGYPGKRYYAGCSEVDKVESMARDRCKKLFNAEHANVQPHAGSQANMAVYAAVLEPGDTIMGMSLREGGHLTHGHGVNFSGRFFKSAPYAVDPDTGLIDYQEVERLANQHRPKMIIAGASAYSRTIDFERFAKIAHSVDAFLLADIAHIAGLVATGLHPTPVGHADLVTSTTHKTLRGPRGAFALSSPELAQALDRGVIPGTQGGPFLHAIAAKAVCFELAMQPKFHTYQKNVISNAQELSRAMTERGYNVVTGGTDNHMFIIDLRAQDITGRAAAILLEKAGIVVSASCIPFDPAKPWITSGIRFGTPAMTTRGMGLQDMHKIAEFVDQAIKAGKDEAALATIKKAVDLFCNKFPLFVY